MLRARLLSLVLLVGLCFPAAASADAGQQFLAPQQQVRAAVKQHQPQIRVRLRRLARHIKRCDALQSRGPRDPELRGGDHLSAMMAMLTAVAVTLYQQYYRPVQGELLQAGQQYGALQAGDAPLDAAGGLLAWRVRLLQEAPRMNLCAVATGWQRDHFRGDHTPAVLLKLGDLLPDRQQQKANGEVQAQASRQLQGLGMSQQKALAATMWPFSDAIYNGFVRLVDRSG